MSNSLEAGFATATDLADALVQQKQIPFREAHHVVGRLVAECARMGLPLKAVSRELREKISPLLSEDSFYLQAVDEALSADKKISQGGTAKPAQLKQLASAAEQLCAFEKKASWTVRENPFLTPEILRDYKSIFAECLTAISDDLIPSLVRQLDSIQDDADEFNEILDPANLSKKKPTHWISLFRFIRFALARTGQIKVGYEKFVGLYQTLSGMPARNADQEQLLKETGDFLYSADELTGGIDRLSLKLLKGIRAGMVETYGIVLTPKEEMYAEPIPRSIQLKLEDDFRELAVVCQKMNAQIQVMEALERIQSFILS